MNKQERFHNILFDLDGTLTDPALGITSAAQYALRNMGIEVEDIHELEWLIGPPLIVSFMEGFDMTEAEAKTALSHYRTYFSSKGLFENEIYPGIAELLADLKADGRRLIVATSKPEEYTHKILEHFDIAKYFDFVGGNTLTEDRPKKSDVIAYIIDSLGGIAPDNTIMVGDRRYDVEGARQFGIDCIGVLYGYGDKAEHEAAGAAIIAETIDGLRSILL